MPKKKSAQAEAAKLSKHIKDDQRQSNATIQALLDATPESALLVDSKGKVLAINEIAAQRMGKSKKGLIGCSVYDFLPADGAENRAKKLQQVLASGRPLCFADARAGRHYYNRLYPVLNSDGNVEKIAIFAQDLTLQHQIELALGDSEKICADLLINSPNPIIVVNPDTSIRYVNPAFEIITGFSSSELTGSKAPYPWWIKDTISGTNEDFANAFDTGTAKLEKLFQKKNGEQFWVETTAKPVRENGRIKYYLSNWIEITERKRNEEMLKETKNLLSSTFDAIQDLMIVIDKDLRVVASNWKDHDYISEKECRGNPYCYTLTMRRKIPCEHCRAMEVFANGGIKVFEHTNPFDGQTREIQVVPILDDHQNVVMVVEHLRNITDRKRAEEALRQSEERFKSIFENALIGFYRTTPDGRILDANPTLIKMLGYSCLEELAAVNLETHAYHPQYPRRLFRERIERDGEIKGMESLWKRPDGTMMYIRENARAIRDAAGNIVCYEGTIEDFTDHKRAKERINTLSQQLMQAHESERQMISQELHDRVAQDLSSLKIGLDTIFDGHPGLSPEIQKKIPEFSGILQRVIGNVRDLSYELRLWGLNEMGLIPALSMYCEEFAEKSGIEVNFQSAGMGSFSLDSDTEISLYRLIQEGLINVRKHAAADHATVKLLGASPNIILRIEDDGLGFDLQERARTADKERRMGLRSMAERVSLLRGEMTIQSQPMKGTRIFIKFPYQEKKHGSKENHIDR